MMRRSRISVRPNVRPGGRGPASTGEEGKPALGSTAEDVVRTAPSQQPVENGEETAAGSTSAPDAAPETSSGSLEQTTQNGETSSACTPVATSLPRRKRVSAMPNLAKPRVAPGAAHPSVNATGSTGRALAKLRSDPQGPALLPEDQAQAGSGAPRGLRSPDRPTTSGGARQSRTQETPGSTLSVLPGVAPKSGAPSQGEKNDRTTPLHSSRSTDLAAVTQQNVKNTKTPTQVPSVVLPKVSQGSTLSEKALPSTSTEALKGLHVSSDRQKILKARRLKELMKQEMKKEREKERKKSSKPQVFEFQTPLDTSKMTMRDLIYYLPPSNPMKSQLVNNCPENGNPAPPRDELPERIEMGLEEEDDNGEDEAEEEQELMVPRVKVAEDGSLIIDENSLTVQVQRSKGPAIVENTDPVFERGSTTTYSSFRKLKYTKHWSDKETDMFFLAISMVGTDFSMIGQLFPHRARTEIKNKFKKEERANGWRIDKAFREKRPYDQEFFSMLLEKILAADQMKKNKNNRNSAKKPRRKRKDKIEKQAGESPDTVEDEVDNNMAEGDLEMAEKENEDSSNVLEPGDNTSATRNRNKRKAEKEAKEVSSKEPKLERKNRKRIKKSVDDEVLAIFGDSDDDVTDSQSAAEQAVSSTKGVAEENGKETVPKSAQSRGRLRKSLPNIGKKGAKRTSKSPEKSKDDGFTENVDCNDDHIMVEAEASDLEGRKAKKMRRVLSSDEECTAEDLEEQHDTSTVQEEMLDKPTRSGRIPKLSKSLKQAEEDNKAVSPPTSPPAQKETSSTEHSKRRTGKSKPNLPATNRKGCMSNSKLVSLQPSSPEVSKDDCNNEQEEGLCPTNPEEETLFPLSEPAGLSSPVPLPEEVQETMEEDMIGTFSPEQLDGLAKNTERACEAARTLLSISDSELPQIEEAQNTENLSVAVESPCQDLLEEPKSFSSSQMVQSLCSPEAPECVVSAIPDMVASEPIKEVNPTEEFTTSGELDQEPSETGSSASCRESFDKILSVDPLVQIAPQGCPPTESLDLPTTGDIHPEGHDVVSQKPTEDKNIELYNTEAVTTEQSEKVSEEQNRSSDKPARGEVFLDIAKDSYSSVESNCQGRRQFPKPNLGQAVQNQHTSTSQSNDALSTSVPVNPVLQIPVNEEENNAENDQPITPKLSEKRDEQSLKLDKTLREAGLLEGVADMATSVQSVLPKKGLALGSQHNLRQTVEAICVTAAAAAAAAAAVPVSTVSEKPAEEVQLDSENVIKETSSERNEAEESDKQTHGAQRVEDSSDSTVGPDSVDRTPASKPVPQGRRSRFPKPRPNLSRASRIPPAVVAQSTDSSELKDTSEDGDLKTVPPVDKNRIPGLGLLVEEKQQVSNVISDSMEDPKISPKSPSGGEETEGLTDEAMQVIQVTGMSSGKTEQAVEEGMAEAAMDLGSSCANVASGLPAETDPYSNATQVAEGMPVTTGYTESEPTFVLTLFSVNDEPFPPPLESTDPQPELLVTESEPQSSKALLDSTVEAWPEGSEVSNLFISDPFVPLCEDQERVTKQDQMSEWCTPSDQKHSTVDPEDLSEKKPAVLEVAEPHVSQALSVAESHASVVTDTEEHTYRKTQPPLSPKGRKKPPPRSRKAKSITKGKQSEPKKGQAKLKEEVEKLATCPPSPPTVQCTAITPTVEVFSKEETMAVSSSSEPTEDTRNQLDPFPVDRKAEDGAQCESGGEKQSIGPLSPRHSLSAPLTRSGRKPRGFLSFMSNSSASETASPLSSRSLSRRPNVNISHTVRNRTSTNPDQACSLPSTTKDDSPLANSAEVPSSSDPGQSELLCVRTTGTDEEPSNVSEFFFGDIFTEVEDPLLTAEK
ncbi:transcription factor TFIIIB component B'' homolog isoform X3 [Scleropages formosus]|uniref:transcription factor TFIIIB component B'' homolog isoform X3 n=1 Tax=Scleropages formosus TaxID=113540 RepID=UPI0010FA966C|nr:transcription factor TFIIIB component B'' homolog isoform X3 [Scleropages formosus]